MLPYQDNTTAAFLACHPPGREHSEARLQASLAYFIEQEVETLYTVSAGQMFVENINGSPDSNGSLQANFNI